MNLTQFNPMKCLAHADKIRVILDGDIPTPVLVHLDLTNRCNFRCSHCYVENYISNRTEMPYSVVEKIINEIADYGVRSIIFSGGGEPTVHPDFLRIIQLTVDRGLEIGLATNGTQLYKWVGVLPIHAFKYIRVSFDAGNKRTYDQIHKAKEKDFARALSVATDFNETQVGMGFLVTSKNLFEIREAIELADAHNFDYISIRPATYKSILTKTQLKIAQTSSNYSTSGNIKVYSLKDRFAFLIKKKNYVCRSTPLATVITADGKLNICCQHRGNFTYQWGDLQKELFKSLWNNQTHRTLLNKIKNEPCPSCVCKMSHYNEIIEKVFVKDDMHLGFL